MMHRVLSGLLRCWLLVVGLIVCCPAWAVISVTSATVNNMSSVTVLPGATVSVKLNVTTTSGTNWRSTYWQVGNGTMTCVNHANHNGSGSYSETFSITVPNADGTYNLSLWANATDTCTGATDYFMLPSAIVVAPPTVTSINRASASPTANPSVQWTVVFSRSVTGVDASDFALAQSGGLSGASISSVTGSGTTWTVTASTGSGAGVLGLNLVDNDSIVDAYGDKLGGTGAGNGNFTGQTYIINAPSVVSITRASSNPTTPYASVSWSVLFDTSVSGVDASDFVLVQSGGAAGASITSVTGSGNAWTVTAATGTSSTGTIGLNLVDDDSIIRPVNTPLGGTGAGNGNFTGEIYTLQPLAPVLSKTSSTSSAVVGDVITFTLTASNPHQVGLANVVLTDVLPAGMTYSTHVAGSGTVNRSGQTLTWTIPALPAGGSAQLVLAVSLTAKGTLVNTVTSPGSASASATVLVLAGAITHFRMDETAGSWTGAAGEVIDSGGTGLHGQRVQTATTTNAVSPSPTIASQNPSVVGGFCNAGNFDGKAVVRVTDSPKFDYTTQLSASAWIYPTSYPTVELASILSNDVNYEFHLNTSGKLYWWWNSSTLTSAATIPLNKWTHIAITFSSAAGAGRQRIYINGVADTNTNSWTGTLAANTCPFYIGGDISTGSGCALIADRNFRGMIDEVKLYDYELSQAEVQADMTLGRSCSAAFDHIRIEHDGVASVCAPETVTVKACLNASCTTLYGGNVTVNLSPSGWVGGDTFTFSGGVTSRQLSRGTAGNVTLTAVSAIPGPANVARCFIGSAENCVMNFANASCAFDGVETGEAPQTHIFTKLAGVPFSLDVLALKTTTTVNTDYVGTVAVDLVDASSSACPTGSGLNTATSVTYAATDQGRKPVTFNYANAARNVRVRARVGTSTPACSSDSFAIRPQAISSVGSSASADATGANATAAPTLKAGSAFTLTAGTGVVGYDGKPKADPAQIEWAGAPAGGRPVPPGPGTGAGTLDGFTAGDLSFATAASAANGNGASGSFRYDEVGYFSFKINGVYDDTFVEASGDKANGDCVVGSFSNTLSGGKYGCNFGNPSATAHFGRFIPDHFDTAVTQGCPAGTFTYSGQPFPLTVTAMNSANGTTQNYSGSFARATALTARDTGDTQDNPGPGVLAPTSLPAAGFAGGVGTLSPAYTFTNKATAPTSVRIRANDGEVSSLATEGSAAIRSGRARLSNAYGSEQLDLPVVFRAEFYDGTGWRLNTQDSCTGDTSLDTNNAVSVALTRSPSTLNTCIRDSGSPGLSGAGCATAAPAAKHFIEGPVLGFAGNFNLWLQAPGVNQFGSVTMTATVPSWLGPVPPALAVFGRYKSPLIYRRENF
jgi:uncharacterized repeat protein (TIGR01451 family)